MSVTLARAESSRVALMLDTTAFKTLAAVEALHHDPGRKIASWMMVCSVSADEHNLKVFQSIVVLDLVSVMHMLVSEQLAPKMFLHDVTVLKHVVTVDSN